VLSIHRAPACWVVTRLVITSRAIDRLGIDAETR